MREAPDRIRRLPEQYFTALLARVAAAAAAEGDELIDLGRGNPEVGPPEHVVHALAESAARPDVHGYAPFAGLPALKEAIAARYREALWHADWVELEGVGHCPQLDVPIETAQLILDFTRDPVSSER